MKYKRTVSLLLAALMVFTGGYINTFADVNTAETAVYGETASLI